MCAFPPDSVGPWLPWSQWSVCSVSCGGGQQSRSRLCSSPPCSGLSRQSKTCNTQVCLGESPRNTSGAMASKLFAENLYVCSLLSLINVNVHISCCAEVGCPPGRLYRECERGEGCPFSCAQVSGREGCYSDGCEEGCHCPLLTYQHHGVCLQVTSLSSKDFSFLID